jgi:16S rRNA (uracil1498-N3)-methyltransferase
MSERFFLATPPVDGRAELVGDEARHLARVLRAAIGDAVAVFDGSGLEWPARVVTIGRDQVTLAVGESLPAQTATGPRLTLAVALPKGDRQKWLVEKLTELGTARLVPLVTARGVAEATESARGRLARGVIEACKQCGRNTLMEIGAAATLETLSALLPSDAIRLLAHPGGRAFDEFVRPDAHDIVAAVGPEGGFTDEEIASAERGGFQRVSLGPHILRIETAAIAIAATLASKQSK